MPVALGAIVEVLPALMALLLILGAGILIEFIGRTISESFTIPGLDFVANWVISAQNKVIGDMSNLLSGTVRGVISFFTAPAHIIAGFLDAVVAFAWAHWTWLHNILTIDLPNLWNALAADFTRLTNYITNGLAWLENYLSSVIANSVQYLVNLAYQLYGQAVTYAAQIESYLQGVINALVAQAEAYALSLYNQAVRYAETLVNQALAYIVAQISAVEKYAQDLANWAIQQAVSIASQYAKQYADWVVGELLNTLTFGCAAAIAPAWPRVLDAIDAIAGSIPNVLDNILEDIRALPRVLPTSIPAILAALLGAAAIAVEYVARCGVDLCKNLHGFGDEVSGLSDAAITAGMIAFIIEATADPEGTAHATDTYFVEPLATVGQGFASIISIVE